MAGFWAKELHAELGTPQGRGEKHGRGRARPGRPPGRSHRPMSRPSPIPIAPSSARPCPPRDGAEALPGGGGCGAGGDADGQTDRRTDRHPRPARICRATPYPSPPSLLLRPALPGPARLRRDAGCPTGRSRRHPGRASPLAAGRPGGDNRRRRRRRPGFPDSVRGTHPPSPTLLTSGFARSCCPAPDIISPGGLPAPRR